MTDQAFNPMETLDAFRPFLELASGYRRVAVELGFSPEAAEAMALEIHTRLVTVGER